MLSNINKSNSNVGLIAPTILLPKKNTNMYNWATVACDQYTSDLDYWNDVEEITHLSPSTYNLMLPEIYLESEDVDDRIKKINENMDTYLKNNFFEKYEKSFVLTRRKTPFSPTRTGLVVALDLECYDFRPGSKSLIRATEGTVTERIPPRMKIRKNASLEMPHILILIDDPDKTVIEPVWEALLSTKAAICSDCVANNCNTDVLTLYSTELMKNGGHIEGYLVNEDTQKEAFNNIFDALAALEKKSNGFLYAVGDGNHSLASAKCHYEELKKAGLPCDNARYALVELVNIHDEGIIFEPIHRVLFNTDTENLFSLMNQKGCIISHDKYENNDNLKENYHSIPYITADSKGTVYIPKHLHTLAVGALQGILDEFISTTGVKIDYIHGDNETRKFGSEANNIGFLLPAMDKHDLFPAVDEKGALPRKTFSMGEACEKRYYMECRIIANN